MLIIVFLMYSFFQYINSSKVWEITFYINWTIISMLTYMMRMHLHLSNHTVQSILSIPWIINLNDVIKNCLLLPFSINFPSRCDPEPCRTNINDFYHRMGPGICIVLSRLDLSTGIIGTFLWIISYSLVIKT